MSEIYEINSKSKYSISYSKIENIEDCGDEFVTREELEEMGVTIQTQLIKCGHQQFNSKITDQILFWKSQVKKGNKSVVCTDDELVEALKDSYYPISYFVENTRRVGNRFFFNTAKTQKEKTKVEYKDWTNLINLVNLYINSFGFDSTTRVTCCKRIQAVDFCKKFFTWDELVEFNNSLDVNSSYYKIYKISEEDMVWCEKLFNDSSLTPLPKSQQN